MLKKDAQEFLDKVADDEPIFILRAQDITMPQTISDWVGNVADSTRLTHGVIIPPTAPINDKLAEATACIHEVENWQNHNHTKIPD